VAGIEASFIEAIGKLKDRLLILLNMDRILGLDEVAATKGSNCTSSTGRCGE